MDQQTTIAIVICILVIVGYAVFLATAYFGPNMKDYFEKDRNRD